MYDTETESVLLWSIMFIILDLSKRKRNPYYKAFQHFVWADLRISGEGFIYSQLLQDARMDLP